ncbi:MAG: type II secretion system F family protein [Acidimicrobiia bacterium]|nr:type II secretion system F family protein [Acidimicrobiia bacterium]
MVFPLVLCVFPALFVVLLGPAAIKVVTFLGCALLFVASALFLEGVTLGLVFVILGLVGTVGPDQLLNRRVGERVGAIERDLPDIIDLMVISIEAGLGFDSALDRVVRHVPGVLSDEFARMLQETRVGVGRTEAMRNLSKRTDVDDLNSFVLALNQADTFGVSIGRMLRVQSEEMRIRRRQRAQERAFAAPVKMVFPLVLCVFPALFVVLLGPAVISIANNLLGG